MPTVILPSTSAQGDLLYDDGTSANTFVTLPKSTTATRYLANTGTNNNPQWAQVDLSNGVTGTLAASNGGTGQSSYAVGDLLYATGTTSLSRLAAVAVGQVLVSGGVSTAPSWSATPTVSVLTAAEGRFQQSSLGAVSTDGVTLENLTAATSGAQQQFSPRIRFRCAAWDNTASQTIEFINEVAVTAGATPVGTWRVRWQRNGGVYSNVLAADTNGDIVITRNLVSGTGSLAASAGGALFFNTRSVFAAPSDGVVTVSNNASTDFNRLQFGGTSASFPALKRSSTVLEHRLADDSGYAGSRALEYYTTAATYMMRASTAWNNGAGAAAGTLTNAPAAGNPTKWIPVDDNGTTRYIPAW